MQALFDRAKKVFPGGVHSPVRSFRGVSSTPRFMASAKGARITDVDGKDYIDFCMSWGPLIFGHQDSETKEAVLQALDRGWTYGTAEPYSLELGEFITKQLPFVEQIRFVSSGTEAVMSALRVARGYTGRSKIIKFDGCYHGHVDSMLVKAGSGLADMASPDSAGVSAAVAGETIVAPLDDLATFDAILDAHGSEVAAVIVEPVPANNGLLLQTEDFLKHILTKAHSKGALVIFDEVITGFRVAFGGMAQRMGLVPDLVTYGKVIGGGFPIGAFGGKKEIMQMVAPAGPVYQAGTLSANPVAVAAGLATLKKLHRENPYPLLEKRTESLARELEKSGERWGLKVQTFASLFWPVFHGEGRKGDSLPVVRSQTKIPAVHRDLYVAGFHHLLDKGFYLAPSAFEVGFVSAAHSAEDLAAFSKTFGEYLSRS